MALFINNNFNPSILIIDDRENMLTMLSYNMRRNGFIVYTAMTAQRAEAVAKEKRPHIIVMADELASVSTLSLCRTLRQFEATATVPLVLIASTATNEEIAALPAGSVTETIRLPIEPAEMVSQIRAIYRKHRPPFTSKILEFDDVVMNLASFKVTKSGREVHLGPTEFKILQCLMEFPKRTLSREYIMTYVWGEKKSSVEMRTIDVHINRLRTALKEADNDVGGEDRKPPIIETIRSAGYCMRRESAIGMRRPSEKMEMVGLKKSG